MALQCDIKKFGMILKDAYLFIDKVDFNRQLLNPAFNNPMRDNAVIGLIIFTSEKARVNKEEPVETRDINFTLSVEADAGNPVEQAYEYLKTLDEFKESENA